ncbi:beta-lactamase domain-containing protein [Periconia macrospinosa]|uniref:Beta-lactamase domain-containing protein n=1 Tax=Periconia macrospinosa TaxID=97972 RepID=A0A2V1DX93_9PLEO|nr:beta-lactamase domain-containing protein [Periconia macrospinosa]
MFTALLFFGVALGCGPHIKPRFLAPGPSLQLSARYISNVARQNVRPPGTDPLLTLRTVQPYPGIFAYYDGRTGERFHSAAPNWLDDGAFTLGVATYSIVSGSDALLFDAAITPEIAAFMLNHVKSLGATKITTVYSHFHNDHIAGAVSLAGNKTTVLGQTQTKATIKRNTVALARDDPPIQAVLPTVLYDKNMTMQVGNRTVELHNFNVHTPDGTILFLPQDKILFAGDTLEDTATFIADADSLPTHQLELERMAQLPIAKILPAHGSPDRIAAGGYDPTFIDATLRYIRAVDEPVQRPAAWDMTLEQVVAADVSNGSLIYFAQYEEVHRSNVESVQQSRAARTAQ